MYFSVVSGGISVSFLGVFQCRFWGYFSTVSGVFQYRFWVYLSAISRGISALFLGVFISVQFLGYFSVISRGISLPSLGVFQYRFWGTSVPFLGYFRGGFRKNSECVTQIMILKKNGICAQLESSWGFGGRCKPWHFFIYDML